MEQQNYTTKRIREIRDLVTDIIIVSIGAVLIVSLFFGAAIQRQDQLAQMAVQEVQG